MENPNLLVGKFDKPVEENVSTVINLIRSHFKIENPDAGLELAFDRLREVLLTGGQINKSEIYAHDSVIGMHINLLAFEIIRFTNAFEDVNAQVRKAFFNVRRGPILFYINFYFGREEVFSEN